MKKIIKSLIFAVVSAMTFYACSKAYDDIASTDLIKLTISTDKPELYDETRTMVDTDGKTPMWCPEDAIGVSVFANGSYTNHEFTNDNTDAPSVKTTFSGSVAVGDMIYTYYPYSANGVDAQGRASVEIPSVQYPTPTSFDGAADILVGKPVVMTPATTTVEGLQFKRVGGFLKIVLNDTTAENLITGEKVESLSVTAENNLAGNAYLDIVNGELGNISANGTAKITAKYNSDTEYKIGDENSAVYIGVYPQTLTEGSTITISAKTTSYDIERTITLPVDIDIKAGGITTLNIKISSENISEKMLDIEETFPDPIFRRYVSDNFDTDKDGKLSKDEVLAVTTIIVSKTSSTPDKEKIASLEGVQYFANLEYLSCFSNQLTTLDVSGCTALETLYCSNNQLTTLDLSKNTALTYLWCSSNQLTSLNVSQNTALLQLDCYVNQLTTLDASGCTALRTLNCFNNQLTALDVSKNTALSILDCQNNQLATLDLSKNTALEHLDCYDNQLTTLDVSNNMTLEVLQCYNNKLTNLEVGDCTALAVLSCENNQLATLDVSNNKELRRLWCNDNQLTTLDLSKNTALTRLYCYNNQLTTLDLSKNTTLTELYCYNNQLTTLDLSKTKLGNSPYDNPLNCAPMETLQTLYLKTGWEIEGITSNRSTDYIPEQTQIEFVSGD